MDESSSVNASVNEAVALGEDLITHILHRAPLEVIKAEVEAGAPLWYQDEEGTSALHAAAYVENEELISFLLEKGAIWNAGESSVVASFQHAAQPGQSG